jgi:purine catabolism regulator
MFSVKDFLDSGLLPWYNILSGADGLANRPIEFVAVIELPVADFVRENELVLSTAVGCEDADSMLDLISGVQQSQASALLLANQADVVELPQKCVDFITAHNFPVILIPWKYRFADITEAVLRQIRDYTSQEVLAYEKIQKELLSEYLQDMPLDAAAQTIAAALCCPCAIYDVNLKPKGVCKTARRGSHAQKTMNAGEMIAIETNQRLYGYLQVSAEKPAVDINRVLVDRYLLSSLILWFDKELVIHAAKQSVKDDFIWRLAKGLTGSEEDMIAFGEHLGFNLLCAFSCIVGNIHVMNNIAAQDHDKWLISNINYIKEEILLIAAKMRHQIMATHQRKLLIIYFENRPPNPNQSLNRFLDSVENKLESIFPGLLFSWGISEISDGPTNFHDCYVHAKLAQDLCSRSISANVRYTYENTILHNMLSILAANHTAMERVSAAIKPLINYDAAHQTALLETLKMFLQYKNVSETARRLHLHRQSLLYRLNKIEKMTNLSLKDYHNMFLLELCLHLHFSL